MNPKFRLILELRQSGVSDNNVLRVIEEMPREVFVPEALKHNANENTPLPIGYGQTISQPLVVGLMTQALRLNNRIKVLEIGTGSGYQAAILSKLCRRVYTMERHRPLLQEAEQRFREMAFPNITAIAGDGTLGWPEQAPFERILVTAAAIDIPEILVDQLAPGGIMVIPVGDEIYTQRIMRVTKTDDGIETEDLGGVRFVPLLPGMGDEEDKG
ncbi:MAG: protein-L-isoaspartate(D-aspartate) O-methyltransferase [Rhodospirillales bacterium]|nr:protein-L-isoaspartate(D-aspartate) O-methyltransferase [Rhodospirillales bacterium]